MFLQKQKTSLRHVCLNYFNHSQKKKKKKIPNQYVVEFSNIKGYICKIIQRSQINVITLITYTTPVCCDIL